MEMPSVVEIDPKDLPLPEIPRCLKLRSVTHGLITYEESLKHEDYLLAGHALIYADQPGDGEYGPFRAAIMMQLRYDGTLGFPGGLIDAGESILEGLNRELAEEINWDLKKQKITWDDYHQTRVNGNKKMILHFFVHKLTLDEFVDLEKRAFSASDYGREVLGSIRPPLFTSKSDRYSGFPAFLGNNFVGWAKQQLLMCLAHLKIFDEREIEEVIYFSQNMRLASSRM